MTTNLKFKPVVLKFVSTKTPRLVQRMVIDSCEKAISVVAFDPVALREIELQLKDLTALVYNKQLQIQGIPLYEEDRPL